MEKEIKILHLEDSLKDSELIRSYIECEGIGHEYFLADTKKDFLKILESENIDIILSDYSLPDYNGNEALKVARENYYHIPFIFVSGAMGEDAAINSMLNGATDYVLKNKLERLVPAIKRALHEHELEIKRNQAEINIKEKNEVIEAQNEKYVQINKELAFQNEEKEKRAAELIIAKEHAEESDRLKSAFLANMSHEIRTPMNGILGFADLLQEMKLTGEEQQEYIGIIKQSGDRMLNIINDIMSISKVEAGQMDVRLSETNINENIEYIYTFFKPEADKKGLKISFKTALTANKAIVKTDKEKIYAILTNLVKNALKFTPEGAIEFGYEKKGCYLEFFVKDTGIGIRPEQKEFIFERFRQVSESYNRDFEGAGLGLSISKAFVEMLGGKIWVESEPGKGSVFYFTLPYHVEAEEKIVIQHIVPEDPEENKIKSLSILIVEDDEISEILLSKALIPSCKEILKVRTGAEAIKACRKHPEIDLIMMDIRMPVMDGYEATRQIRKFNKEVIIIAQTAFALSEDRIKAIEAGCNDHISKPIKKDLLAAIIKKHFKKQEMEAL